nr:rab11 family-interacting protein 1-like [Lytechinus pictus]
MSLTSPSLPGNICRVVAHQARDLIYKGKEDSNNAFVTFTLNKNKFATSVLEKIQTPVWNEECEFVIADQGGTLELVVCHSDFLRERFLGRVEISLSAIAASYGKSVKKWYKLQPKKGKEAKKIGDRGQLEVTVQILYREDIGQQQVKGQEKKPALLNILPSPAWRRRQSGTSPETKRKDSRKDSTNEDYFYDINRELQFNDPAFYSDDSQSVASSMSDDFRTIHHQRYSTPDVVDQAKDLRSQPPTPPVQKPPTSNRLRPGGLTGSARGKGGIGRNVKTALGNISKALSKEHIDKVGVSTPDLRYVSSSLPPTPIHEHEQHHQHGTSAPDEQDGFRNPGVHLGVSSLGGALLAPPASLQRAVSEESLLKEKEEREKGDVSGLATLPRGRHVKRENRHKKAMSACFTVEEFSQANKGDVTPDLQKTTHESKEKQHMKQSSTSKYDTLTKQQLVNLVQQQESILSDNIQQIKELEAYIEKLLLRVMMESPDLLDMNRPIKF